MATPLIIVSGTYRQPELRAFFSRNAPHPRVPGKGLIDLMKSFPSAYYRSAEKCWFIKAIGRFDADAVFARAGFEIDFESETYDTDLEGVDTLDELVPPMVHLTQDRRTVLVRHRLYGFDPTKKLLGSGAMWDRARQRFYMPVGDLIKDGEPRDGLDIPEDALEAAWDQHERIHTDDDILKQARKAALAKDVVDLSEKEIATLVDRVGDVPKWFGLGLYPYQRVGAIAVAAGHNLLADGMRVGKAEWVEEPVLTPQGFRRIGDVEPGWKVIGSDGKPTTVLGVYPQGIRKLFRVTMSDGASTVVDGEHLWTVITNHGKVGSYSKVMTTNEIATHGVRQKTNNNRKFRIPVLSEPVEFAPLDESLPVHPYALGVLLGDGHIDAGGSVTLTCADPEIVDRLRSLGVVVSDMSRRITYGMNGLSSTMRDLGLAGTKAPTKFIPDVYLRASIEERLELVRGLMDTDGWVMKRGNTAQFTSVSERLVEGFVELVRSLGGIARVSRKAIPKGGNYVPINVTPNIPFNPFSLERKASVWRPRTKFHPTRLIDSIEPFGSAEAVCIEVSAEDSLYVTRDYIVTHNTRTSLAVAAMREAKRTLIVCPPVVLTNWHRNVDESLLATLGGKNPNGQVVEFRTGRKEPEIPDSGVVIISDSLLTSRAHIQDKLIEWSPDVMLYDEAIDLEESILTTAGWKTVGSLREGDHVFAPSGEPVLVKRLTPIKDDAECLRVTLSDGSSVVVDAGHLWLAEPRVNGGSAYLKPRVVTTRQLLDSMVQGRTWRLPEVYPVEGVEKELPLPPYVLGAWLGDGSADQPHITVSKDRTDALVAELGRHWGDVRVIQASPHKANRVSLADSGGVGGKPSLFRTAAEEIGVWGNKHIPDDYLLASADQRLELLRGLMDTDGYVSRVRGELRNVFTFSNTNKRIIDGFVYLVRSLGMIPGVHENKNYGRGEESVCWRVSFTAAPGISLFSMRNQDSTFVSVTRAMKRRIVSIEPVESRQVRCIEVDSEDHLFLVGKSLIPTHNCHRAKNFESARTQTVLRVAASSEFPLPMTGTPLFQTPQELAPLLEMTGHLTPVFGGLEEFMETYCWQNKWGGWNPRLKTLPELRKMLDTYVWVRRTKDQVLTDLPKVSRSAIDLDIDLKLFNAAHKDVAEAVNEWIDEFLEGEGRLPDDDEIDDYAHDNGIRYISRMRRAAGLAKIPSAVEYIKDHVRSTTDIDERGKKSYTRPLLVWTHHKEISEEMSQVVPNEVDDAAIIMGGISQNKRQRLIDEFQDGRIPVLVCQISAAGVGIDLTRSSDALFVETDWVNALVQQAEERIQGVNQKRPVMLNTMVAAGTLDDRIQRIQEDKSKILDPLLGGKNDVSVVSVSDDEANSSAILIDIIKAEIAKRKKRKR